ncbi:hypothetical protein B0H13DRAFT_640491 [Mycena leptocephala]|nr:hypothetical protein B0H13DRAFT_640491 [Mycena leptocephala]
MNDPDTQNANDTNGDADRAQIDSGNGTNNSGKEPKAGKAGLKASASSGFFAWVSPVVRNSRLLKTWIRCVLIVAASMVLLVDSATLRTMGQAGFFAAIVSVLLPPSLALSVFVLASVTLLLGMLLGWAWGAACMAAALSVHDKSLLAARLAAAQKGLVPNISPALQLQSLTFHGAFLDARSSAVYGAMFFVGTFGMGVLRARMPKLALMGIFGTIVMDVVCSMGPCAFFRVLFSRSALHFFCVLLRHLGFPILRDLRASERARPHSLAFSLLPPRVRIHSLSPRFFLFSKCSFSSTRARHVLRGDLRRGRPPRACPSAFMGSFSALVESG